MIGTIEAVTPTNDAGTQASSREVSVAETGAAEAAGLPDLASRVVALIGLIVVFVAIRAGEAFFIPLAISVFLTYALSPLVSRLERWRMSRPVAAGIVMVIFVTAGAAAVYRAGTD